MIGGANLMGGEASAYGAFIGAALIFVIRNALLMAGVDSNWQGTFVGVFLIAAVYLGKSAEPNTHSRDNGLHSDQERKR